MKGSKVTSHVLSWYRQMQGKEMQFLLSHREKNHPAYGDGISQRFIPEIEESTNTFLLTIGNTDKRDEGVYYCAVWFSSQYIFGEGTEIKVQDIQDARRPRLTLLGPSSNEVQLQHSATFLCHAASYFPKALRVKWLINRETSIYGSVTFLTIHNADNTFHQTAGITIPASLWKQGAEVTCLLEHETGVQNISTKAIIQNTSGHKKTECKPVTTMDEKLVAAANETAKVIMYGRTILSTAFYAYGAALGASCLYGILLSFCYIRRKSGGSKDANKDPTRMSAPRMRIIPPGSTSCELN
ncbi:immunoglobulin lambda-1 light chain-like [Ascaphus truei]|uniref:immunoglobulin lambda-1 light chain-like n=1 Tax=Ascaphus truei TaxID=8439 RepID=UPI003F5AC01D